MKFKSKKFIVVGSFLKTQREKAGLSQGDVSKKLGWKSPQLISDWERGISGPPKDALYDLCKMYKIKEEKMIDVILGAEREELESCF